MMSFYYTLSEGLEIILVGKARLISYFVNQSSIVGMFQTLTGG